MAATVSQTCLLGFPHPGPVQATTGAHPDTGHHFRTATRPRPVGRTSPWPAFSSTNRFTSRPCSAPTPGPPALITPPCQGPPQAQPRSHPHAPCAPLFRSHPPTAPGLGVHPKPRRPPPHRCLSPPRLVPSPAGPPGLSFSTRCPQRARPTPQRARLRGALGRQAGFAPRSNAGAWCFHRAVGPRRVAGPLRA